MEELIKYLGNYHILLLHLPIGGFIFTFLLYLLQNFLKENGIGTLIQWGGTAIHQFKNLGFNQICPNTERFFERCIMLPMNVFISDDDVHYICDKVEGFYRK